MTTMLEEVPAMTERHADERQHVADTIRAERLQRGWSVGEAARQVEVYGSAWSRWENGVSTPKPAMLKRLGELFGLPDDWMVPATMQHPAPTVGVDELDVRLARIEERQKVLLEELRVEHQRLEHLYNLLMNGEMRDDDEQLRRGGRTGDRSTGDR